MKIIFLSGGSGKRLWPLSNDTRSKQFLKLLTAPDGTKESMVQRNVRQLKESGIDADIIFATSKNQVDAIRSQFGDSVEIVVEPSRRDTFPAIALASAYLAQQKNTDPDEVVVVMPCDQYTEISYFAVVGEMAKSLVEKGAELVLMGITPGEPSSQYGYILPEHSNSFHVRKFIEKPDTQRAKALIAESALWNGGVFAFRLGWILKIVDRYIKAPDFESFLKQFEALPKRSFDYEVVENAHDIGVCPFSGTWRDLGTWDALTAQLPELILGNGIATKSNNTTIVNELNIPIVCHGVDNMIVAASYDGILVSHKNDSGEIKSVVSGLDNRPMYEERRWGTYKVVDTVEFPDGHKALTKQLTLNPGKSISYQRHMHRAEVWTFIDGTGEIVLDGVRKQVSRGDVIHIAPTQMHALRATTPLTFIEVQSGSLLIEEDIERFPYDWD